MDDVYTEAYRNYLYSHEGAIARENGELAPDEWVRPEIDRPYDCNSSTDHGAYSIRCSAEYVSGNELSTVRALTYADGTYAVLVWRDRIETVRRESTDEQEALALFISACQQLADQGGNVITLVTQDAFPTNYGTHPNDGYQVRDDDEWLADEEEDADCLEDRLESALAREDSQADLYYDRMREREMDER